MFCLSLCVLFITGCGCSKKEKIKEITCTINEKYESYTISATYDITYDEKSGRVYSYEEEEKIENADLEVMESLKTYANERYEELNKLENFDFDVAIDNDKLVNKVKINYDRINKEKLLEKDNSYNNYIVNGEFNYEKIVEEIKNIGAECK